VQVVGMPFCSPVFRPGLPGREGTPLLNADSGGELVLDERRFWFVPLVMLILWTLFKWSPRFHLRGKPLPGLARSQPENQQNPWASISETIRAVRYKSRTRLNSLTLSSMTFGFGLCFILAGADSRISSEKGSKTRLGSRTGSTTSSIL